MCVDHRDFTARLESDEHIDAARIERRSARDARVVVIEARRRIFDAGERDRCAS